MLHRVRNVRFKQHNCFVFTFYAWAHVYLSSASPPPPPTSAAVVVVYEKMFKGINILSHDDRFLRHEHCTHCRKVEAPSTRNHMFPLFPIWKRLSLRRLLLVNVALHLLCVLFSPISFWLSVSVIVRVFFLNVYQS